jgi:hypothetical protein
MAVLVIQQDVDYLLGHDWDLSDQQDDEENDLSRVQDEKALQAYTTRSTRRNSTDCGRRGEKCQGHMLLFTESSPYD